jgi:hypothetical protein
VTLQTVIEQVAGILHRNEVPFQTRADGNGYRMLHDSTAIFVTFAEYGETVMISVHSPVLQEIDETVGLCEILSAVNDRNASARFARFVYYSEERVIAVEYDLAGDELQESELLLALQRITYAANTQDEELRLRLGTGLRFTDTLPEV